MQISTVYLGIPFMQIILWCADFFIWMNEMLENSLFLSSARRTS